MKQGFTDITVVLDRSGSMSAIKKDVIGGYNSFLKAQKDVEGEAIITLITFDTASPQEVVQNRVAIKDAAMLGDENFMPRGGTPLYDAIGMAITNTGVKLAAMEEKDRPEKVVFVIITDGEENSSREFDKQAVKAMIETQTNVYKWEFVFLAANQDAMQTGTSMGFSKGNSMTYAATGLGMNNAFSAVASNLRSYRAGGQSTMAVTEEQRVDSMAK